MTKRHRQTESLSASVTRSMQQYFVDMNGQTPTNLQAMFIEQVERPFLEVVMQQVNGNQSHAATMLGINRNTLRKKLAQYDLL